MKVHNSNGSKERLKEMFERVNKIKLNESGLGEDMNSTIGSMSSNGISQQMGGNPRGMSDGEFNGMLQKNNLSKQEYQNLPQKKKIEIVNTHSGGLNETFDIPVVDDKKYLDKTGDQPAEKEQRSSKYDGGVDYPAIDDLKTDHESLDKIAEEESLDEISLAGLKGAGKHVGDAISNRVNKFVGTKQQQLSNIKQAYQSNAATGVVDKLEKQAVEWASKFGELVAKYNERITKYNEEVKKHNEKSGITGRDKKLTIKPIEPGVFGDKIKLELVRNAEARINSSSSIREDEEPQDVEDLADDSPDPNEFLPDQVLKGMKVELEHSEEGNPDYEEALRIAMDHLAEIPDYYERLDDMEDEAGVEGEEEMPTSTMRAMADDVRFADPKDQPQPRDDGSDDSANKLLDPSEHWIDHYSPMKLGDEMEIEETEQDWDGNKVGDDRNMPWADFAGISKDQFMRLSREQKDNILNKYYAANPPQDTERREDDPNAVASFYDKYAQQGHSMDEQAIEMKFEPNQYGTMIPTNVDSPTFGYKNINGVFKVFPLEPNGQVKDMPVAKYGNEAEAIDHVNDLMN